MTDYAVGIDRGTNQDSKTLRDVCNYLRQCSGGKVVSLGIGPSKVQNFGLSSQSKGMTGVYITNGVGFDTPEDFEVGIGSYYHYDKCIFVWPQWIGNQYMSDHSIQTHIVPREHDFTNVQFGVGGQRAVDYFSQTSKVSLVAAPNAQQVAQKICSGAFVSSSGNTSSGSSSSSTSTSNTSPLLNGEMTFEELVQEICDGTDLMFLPKRSTVVVTDFETIFAEAKYLRDHHQSSIASEDIKLWQLEEDSYQLSINQHGFYNTVYVEYSKGKVKETFADLVRVYGEVPITYKEPKLDKTSAIMKAKAYLAAHIRDFELTIDATVLSEPDIDIGDIVTMPNPLTLQNDIKKAAGVDPEYLFVSGVSTSWEGDGYISTDLETKFAPTSPKRAEVPTAGIKNGSGSGSGGSGGISGSYGQCGLSSDGQTIMAIGKPSAAGESKYGYTFYKSVFQNKCPFCGKSSLVWDALWSSSDYGYSKCKGGTEGSSLEGAIFCKNCDADFSCINGSDHESPPRAKLTRVAGPVKSSKTELYQLKKGQLSF